MYRVLTSSALALIATAIPALAEVTPAQVWDDLESYYTDMGYQVRIGGRDETGQSLTLTDVTLTSQADEAAMTVALPRLTLRQTGDAKVRTVVEGEVTARGEATVEGETAQSFDMTIDLPGNEMLSSGEPGNILHQLRYPSLKAAITLGDEIQTEAEAPIVVTLTDLAGDYRSVRQDGRRIEYDLAAAAADLTLSAVEPTSEDGSTGGSRLAATTRIEDLTLTGSGILHQGEANPAQRPDLALQAGMRIEARIGFAGVEGQGSYSGTTPEGQPEQGEMTFASGEGELGFEMSSKGLAYEGRGRDARTELKLSSLPFPIGYGVEEFAGQVRFPVSPSETPQPFRLAYRLSGLTLADALWDMFDPQKQLPRDPASLNIDLDGQALVRQSLLDPSFGAQMEEYSRQMEAAEPGADIPAPPSPFQPTALTINDISLQAVGVVARLTGDLTLNPDGQPPVGTIQGSFSGVNALLDKLVAMGVMPQEQVMGARMMIAMFARPADGNPDRLTTTLELRENGSIFANGQQVK